MDKANGKRRRVTMSIDDTWHEKGKLLAEDGGRDFSHYVEFLIKQDEERAKKEAANGKQEAAA